MGLNERTAERHTRSALIARVAKRHKEALSEIPVGNTREKGSVRIHRYRDHLEVTDLINAGKRGKRVEVTTVSPSYTYSSSDGIELLGRLTKFVDVYRDYRGVISAFEDYLRDYPNDLKLNTYQRRGVDVTPAGFKPIVIKTDNVLIEAEYDSFRVKNLNDEYNEPTCIPATQGGKKSIPVFYRWVQDNEAKIRRMEYNEILSEMSRLGIRSHSFCAID